MDEKNEPLNVQILVDGQAVTVTEGTERLTEIQSDALDNLQSIDEVCHFGTVREAYITKTTLRRQDAAPLTKRKFIKLLMAGGLQRNDARQKAEWMWKIPYFRSLEPAKVIRRAEVVVEGRRKHESFCKTYRAIIN